ncbi:nucleotide pyrophosphatase [Lentzea guizhouensis]|uniref:Nucleotide pyrophosphatase n=1 Tax=Lentzea guizhouensis TaxID=1586287 RepID=A0A1B2HLR4_9PSEU|nr:alkaline phosphatase family protein [Lentzea guizhouensis]ANZ38664.1 nucleotide pyrophosphatase [Lentzea guizhouensis]
MTRAALALLLPLFLLAPAAVAAPAKTPKVLVIGLDGARYDKLLAADTPNIHALLNRGYGARSSLYGSGMAATSSGPGWSTVLTGVWPDKHKVKDNSFTGNALASHPSWLERANTAKPALSTYAAVDWKPISDRVLRSGQDRKYVLDGDTAGYTGSDEKITADAEQHLRSNAADASFVYLGQIDIAGHDHGADSSQYAAAMRTNDAQIGRLVKAVESRPTYANEDWLIMMTTDHGHTAAGGHGGDSPEERMTFVISTGAARPAVAPKLVDVAATALRHLGVSAALDGYALGSAPVDAFDSVPLKPRQDETGVPSSVLGWTHQGPAGWTVTTASSMPQGVAEWQGWSFTTDDFWTRTAPSQSREANVRARGVFAVADPDEWDDKGSPSASGRFDSTMTSPAYDVTGRSSARIEYGSHYLQEGTQRGTVAVSFDGGPAQVVRTHDANGIAQQITLDVAVPPGARSVKVSWRLFDAGNNWYWAVDAPRLS